MALAAVFCVSGEIYSAPEHMQEAEDETPKELRQLYAQSAVLMDADSGRILFEKNGYEAKAMASTTKIMTCITALENADLESTVEVSDYAASMPDVQLNIRKGETYRLEDLLYSLMLESHNDSAVAIAEHVGGSVEGFAGLMNQKARDIGCYDTYFITPNGLDAKIKTGENETERVHSTTAADLAKIMRYCINTSPMKEEFLEITRTASYSFSDLEGSRSYSCNNHNAFLNMMEGALSGKTGFTGNAGYCYVGALKRDGKTFVVALLACGWPNNKSYKWADTKKLMNYGLEYYEYRDVFQKGKQFQPVEVECGVPEDGDISEKAYVELNMKVSEQEQLKLLLRTDEEVRVEYELPDKLEAPVEIDAIVGNAKYYLGTEIVKVYPIYTSADLKRIDFKWCFRKIINQYIIGIYGKEV